MEYAETKPKTDLNLQIKRSLVYGFFCIQFAILLLKAWEAVRANHPLFPLWMILLVDPLPLVVGMVSKRRLQEALRRESMSERLTNMCDELVSDILLATYFCVAFLL